VGADRGWLVGVACLGSLAEAVGCDGAGFVFVAVTGIPRVINPDGTAAGLFKYFCESALNFSTHDAQQK